ncbi:leucine-rich repeat-containing protein 51 isoform X2 [Struthio camelus]|uniref:leucine-rich repeat-containing protein 51 isoform X2 n=1 Tax=Struthio camelus TaxID=8801 RepID=UPI003603BC00
MAAPAPCPLPIGCRPGYVSVALRHGGRLRRRPRPHGAVPGPGAPPRLLLPRRHLHPSLAGLAPALERLLEAPERLSWLDLSFNALPTIDPVLTAYRHLRSLHLHANGIRSLAEVDKLAALPRLRRLTLHGNPVEEQPGYRSYVISVLPQLKSFDFSGVTKQDRSTAAAWKRMQAKPKAAGKAAAAGGSSRAGAPPPQPRAPTGAAAAAAAGRAAKQEAGGERLGLGRPSGAGFAPGPRAGPPPAPSPSS